MVPDWHHGIHAAVILQRYPARQGNDRLPELEIQSLFRRYPVVLKFRLIPAVADA